MLLNRKDTEGVEININGKVLKTESEVYYYTVSRSTID